MQMSRRLTCREFIRTSPSAGKSIFKEVSSEILRSVKRDLAEQLVECDNFWDVQCLEVTDAGPYPTVVVNVRIAVAPMGDLEKDNPYRLSSDYLRKRRGDL